MSVLLACKKANTKSAFSAVRCLPPEMKLKPHSNYCGGHLGKELGLLGGQVGWWAGGQVGSWVSGS